MFKNTQSGRSMIEMLGVLAIIGVLSAGGIAGYSMAMKNYKANKASESFQTIATQAQTIYNGNYTDVNATDMETLGVDFTNPFGGDDISIANADNNKAFELKMTGVEHDACVKLATSKDQWGSMVKGILVGNSSLTDSTNMNTNASFKYTISTANTGCGPDDDSVVIFRFK